MNKYTFVIFLDSKKRIVITLYRASEERALKDVFTFLHQEGIHEVYSLNIVETGKRFMSPSYTGNDFTYTSAEKWKYCQRDW